MMIHESSDIEGNSLLLSKHFDTLNQLWMWLLFSIVLLAASSCASASRDASQSLLSGSPIMPSLNKFIPALHHALVKACANPSPELSAGVENHAREYLMGQIDGKVILKQ